MFPLGKSLSIILGLVKIEQLVLCRTRISGAIKFPKVCPLSSSLVKAYVSESRGIFPEKRPDSKAPAS